MNPHQLVNDSQTSEQKTTSEPPVRSGEWLGHAPSTYKDAMHALKMLYESTAMLRLRISIAAEPVKRFSEWSQSTAAMTVAERTLAKRKASLPLNGGEDYTSPNDSH